MPSPSPLGRSLFLAAVLGSLPPEATNGQEERTQPVLTNDVFPSHAPEIWAAPDPSRLVVRGFCVPLDDLYRLVVEYETDGAPRYRAIMVYAEPSRRLLLVQWNGAPDRAERASIAEKPLASFDADSQRRHATLRFRPEGDDRIRVQVIDGWNQRRDVLAGRVADLCDFEVENRVHD